MSNAKVPAAASLVAAAKRQFPAATSVVLAGSCLSRSAALVSDIDLIVLTDEVAEGEVVEKVEVTLGQPIDIVAYNRLHFLAICRDPDLVLFNLRDIRKLLRGRLLVDDGVGAASVEQCRVAKPNYARLQATLLCALGCRADLRSDLYSIQFFRLLEDVIFLKMHTRVETIYSKHKYLLDDAKALPTATLASLLSETAAALASSRDWPAIQVAFEDWLGGQSDHPPLIAGPFRDVRKLIANQQMLAAVLPFRHVLVRTVIHVKDVQSDRELEDIVYRSFAVGHAIPNSVMHRLDESLAELQTELA
ncbi:hypothetical protein PQR33_14860 [Paraburkholderia sediminicola]|uniref:hypothetical protein n=1 Tax=Paraburkholderia sediminicola TaxID=458836 RepID=UPI0038BDB1C3